LLVCRYKFFSYRTSNAPRGGEFSMSEIKCRKNEPVERVLRRLKKKMDKEGTMRELRNRRHYEKPSEVKRRMSKRAR
ncbi:MAG: 30S ribosomal protein S21, partial [Lentisphaeria bacterium]|nr:30S ribosomal protein S21 [Lentisphaeria bacterium]